jgi:hypothetical protein
MKVFLLVALLCVVPLISGKAVDEASSKCLVNYLKNHGYLGKNHTHQELPANCVQIVIDARNAVLEKFRVYYQKHNETAKNVDCSITNLNSTDVIDRQLIELLDLSQAKANKNTLNDLASVVPMRKTIQIVKVQHSCGSTTSLEELAVIDADSTFNNIFEKNYVNEIRSDEADYCVRKHLQDNGRLDDSIQV